MTSQQLREEAQRLRLRAQAAIRESYRAREEIARLRREFQAEAARRAQRR